MTPKLFFFQKCNMGIKTQTLMLILNQMKKLQKTHTKKGINNKVT
jgi:hypothetical protein